jgi:uncharacterized membrane protein YoaK (UPF0700 family)
VIKIKDIFVISGLTVGIICGAATGIVGGAITISLVAAILHIVMHG